MSCQIAILGAGISGLATAWFLQERLGREAKIIIFEKSSRPGGWIETVDHQGFLFEQGPRSCRTKGAGQETLALIESLGLQDQVLIPHPYASKRYLLNQKQLTCMPRHLWEYPFNPLTQGWLSAFWQDFKNPRRTEEDESIHSFFSRRLGKTWTEKLIDPFVSGIYAGDCHQLSVKSCFPLFDQWEQRKGSLLKGALTHPKSPIERSPYVKEMRKHSLFSFKKGMETLPRALAERLHDSIRYNSAVKRLETRTGGMDLHLENGEIIQADKVISTLPLQMLASLIELKINCLPYASLAIVNIGFDHFQLPDQGFGYLVPSQEKENILGCVWDSSIFPQQNREPNQARLTVMIGGGRFPEMINKTEEELKKIALEAIGRHMGIRTSPTLIQVKKVKEAIPQFPVGFSQWKLRIQQEVARQFPSLILSGTAWSGVSINDCILHAKKLAHNLAEE